MTAEIISIGDELLIGQVINTNASWMAEQLSATGIEVVRITTISDQKKEILKALEDASLRADVVLITGGLGPTKDDITKDALCEYFDSELVFHETTYELVKKIFSDRGLAIREINTRQADVPHNCIPILNKNGTAPGMWFEKNNVIFVSMPGVPYEMKGMLIETILPQLSKRMNGNHQIYRIIQTHGLGESFLSELISEWEDALPENMKLAYLPQPGIVRLRLTGFGSEKLEIERGLDEQLVKLRTLIPELIFGYGDVVLEEIVGKILNDKQQSLSTAESCTGGYIAHLITSIPGSSAYFKGSVVAYSNDNKTELLGVNEETLIAHGAVSEQTVLEMALGVKNKFNTDYAIAVSGVAGPDGGSDEKPVGTIWICIAGPNATEAYKFQFGKNRQRNIRLAAISSLNKLRLFIEKQS